MILIIAILIAVFFMRFIFKRWYKLQIVLYIIAGLVHYFAGLPYEKSRYQLLVIMFGCYGMFICGFVHFAIYRLRYWGWITIRQEVAPFIQLVPVGLICAWALYNEEYSDFVAASFAPTSMFLATSLMGLATEEQKELHLSGVNRDFGAGTKKATSKGATWGSINTDKLLFACLVRFEYSHYKSPDDYREEDVTERDRCDSCCLTLHPNGLIFWEMSKDDDQPNEPVQYTMLRKIRLKSDKFNLYQLAIDDHTGQLQIRYGDAEEPFGGAKWLFSPVNVGEFPWLVEALADFPPTEAQDWTARIRSWFSTATTKKLSIKYEPIERVPIYRPTEKLITERGGARRFSYQIRGQDLAQLEAGQHQFGGGNPRPSTSRRPSAAHQATNSKCSPTRGRKNKK